MSIIFGKILFLPFCKCLYANSILIDFSWLCLHYLLFLLFFLSFFYQIFSCLFSFTVFPSFLLLFSCLFPSLLTFILTIYSQLLFSSLFFYLFPSPFFLLSFLLFITLSFSFSSPFLFFFFIHLFSSLPSDFFSLYYFLFSSMNQSWFSLSLQLLLHIHDIHNLFPWTCFYKSWSVFFFFSIYNCLKLFFYLYYKAGLLPINICLLWYILRMKKKKKKGVFRWRSRCDGLNTRQCKSNVDSSICFTISSRNFQFTKNKKNLFWQINIDWFISLFKNKILNIRKNVFVPRLTSVHWILLFRLLLLCI